MVPRLGLEVSTITADLYLIRIYWDPETVLADNVGATVSPQTPLKQEPLVALKSEMSTLTMPNPTLDDHLSNSNARYSKLSLFSDLIRVVSNSSAYLESRCPALPSNSMTFRPTAIENILNSFYPLPLLSINSIGAFSTTRNPIRILGPIALAILVTIAPAIVVLVGASRVAATSSVVSLKFWEVRHGEILNGCGCGSHGSWTITIIVGQIDLFPWTF